MGFSGFSATPMTLDPNPFKIVTSGVKNAKLVVGVRPSPSLQ